MIECLGARQVGWGLSVCLLSAALLAACGGGGSASGPSDTSPPSVVSVTPAPQASGVLTNATVSVTFSEPLACAQAASGLTVTNGGSALPGTVSCADRTLSFKPASELPTNATLAATVSADVTDLAGNRLGTAYAWQFSLPAWTVHLGSAGEDAFNAVQTDSSGNLFVAGRTQGSFDTTHPSGGAFLAKYDGNGVQQWIRQIGARSDLAAAVAVDADGSVFVGGLADNYPVTTPGILYSIFIAKYDKNGARLWLRTFSSQSSDYVRALRADGKGNVVAVGFTGGSLFGQFAGGSSDFFVMKLDSSGVLLWGRQEGGAGADNAADVAVSASGDLFVAGYVASALNGMTPNGSVDAFVIKYSADGARQWTTLVGSAGADYGQAVKLDVFGNLYLLGRTAGTFAGQTSAGGLDGFVGMLDATGKLQWIRQFGTVGDDYPNAMAIDSSGSLRVAGFTNGAFAGSSLVGGFDAFLVRLDANAALQWARQWGATGDDYVYGLTVDAAGNAYVALTGGVAGIAGAGGSDGFLLNFAADGTPR